MTQKDIPIIFSGPMVRALLEGRKTMTRRILKPQPAPFSIAGKECDVTLHEAEDEPRPRVTLGRVITKQQIRFARGDRLWVRESHRLTDCTCTEACRGPGHVWYQASEEGYRNVADNKLRPSIHMPRWASRLTLIVDHVKVERLQAIGLQDVHAEGCEVRQFWLFGADGPERQKIGAGVFGNLWSEINGRESWDANPFVVAISFRIIKANIDAAEARVAA